MKCSSSSGHSCNVIRVAVIQDWGRTQKGEKGCLVLSVSHPRFACSRAQPLDHCDGLEWRDWFDVWVERYSGEARTPHVGAETNHGPDRTSGRCASLVPGSLDKHHFRSLPALPSGPSWHGYLYVLLPQDALFSTLFLWKHVLVSCQSASETGQSSDRIWLQVIACPPPNLSKFHSIIYKLLGKRIVFIIFPPLSCYFLARFLKAWTSFFRGGGLYIVVFHGKAFFSSSTVCSV